VVRNDPIENTESTDKKILGCSRPPANASHWSQLSMGKPMIQANTSRQLKCVVRSASKAKHNRQVPIHHHDADVEDIYALLYEQVIW